jgi:23S rRNA pseudouridine2605 synthase
MRSSSGRNSGDRNHRGTGGGARPKPAGRRGEDQQRAGRPRPEERRYDVGSSGRRPGTAGGAPAKGGPKGAPAKGTGKPAPAKGAPGKGAPGKGAPGRGTPGKGAPNRGTPGKGAPGRGAAKGGPRSAPARPREYDARIEERNRARHDRPAVALPRTFPGAEQEGERLQKVLARAGMGSRRACEELIEQRRVEVNGEVVT